MSNPPVNPFAGNPAEEIKFRFDEYNNVVENTAKLSDRRQTINDIFVGLNSLFLTALGFLFISLQLTTWWPTALFASIALMTTLVNRTWLRLNDRYRALISIRLRYAQKLEEHMQALGGVPMTVDVSPKGDGKLPPVSYFGVLQVEGAGPYKIKNPLFGFAAVEQSLIWIFMSSYIVLAAIVAGLTIAVMNHWLPGLTIKQ